MIDMLCFYYLGVVVKQGKLSQYNIFWLEYVFHTNNIDYSLGGEKEK